MIIMNNLKIFSCNGDDQAPNHCKLNLRFIEITGEISWASIETLNKVLFLYMS